MSFNLNTKINNLYRLVNQLIVGTVTNPMTTNLNVNGNNITNANNLQVVTINGNAYPPSPSATSNTFLTLGGFSFTNSSNSPTFSVPVVIGKLYTITFNFQLAVAYVTAPPSLTAITDGTNWCYVRIVGEPSIVQTAFFNNNAGVFSNWDFPINLTTPSSFITFSKTFVATSTTLSGNFQINDSSATIINNPAIVALSLAGNATLVTH